MQNNVKAVEAYLDTLPIEQRVVLEKLRSVVWQNLPKGFEENRTYDSLNYVVPHTRYPNGYHCNSKQPLPFLSIAVRKTNVVIHHLGLYANPELMNWFALAYTKHSGSKLDSGKSCIRFKKTEHIPFDLIGES